MSQSHQWQVLSRAECSLCEVMLRELVQLLGSQAEKIQVLDIADDAESTRKYGTRIPVLLIDGELVCAYRLDRERVQQYL